MFMLTVKWNKKTAVLIIAIVAVLLIALVVAVGNSSKPSDPSLGVQLNSCERRVAYLQSLGWIADPSSETMQEILIPREFNEIYEKYNELQKGQGFDLSEYCGMDAELYTYIVSNHPCGEEAVAQLILFADQVIGGDIHSTALNGFMHGIKPVEED